MNDSTARAVVTATSTPSGPEIGPKLATVPLVSVVIPMFNHERYVSECLDSIVSQGYARMELIALDDGSSDGTYSVASDWARAKGSRLERTIVKRQTNQGICRTINTLIHFSRGEYILVLASDDMLCDGALTALVEFHRQHCEPTELLFTNVMLIDLEGKTIADNAMHYCRRNEAAIAANTKLLELDVILCWGTPYQHQFYPRAFYDLMGGYDESLKFEDVYFAIGALARGMARYVPIRSRKYRVRPGQSITPGLDVQTISPVSSRSQGARNMGLIGRWLVRIANYRDTRRKGIRRIFADKMVRLAYRLMYFWRHRVRPN